MIMDTEYKSMAWMKERSGRKFILESAVVQDDQVVCESEFVFIDGKKSG